MIKIIRRVRLWWNPYDTLLNRKEFKRISAMQRNVPGNTRLFGRAIHFTDNYGFLCSVREIFIDKQSYFSSTNDSPKILDVGANIGLTTIYFKMLYPNAKIISFEPDPRLAAAFRMNIESFQLNNIEFHEKAVWYEAGILDFYSQGSLSGHLAVDKAAGGVQRIKVEAVTLSEFLRDGQVDFLNMDMEGAEQEVIPSISNDLKNIKQIFCEYHTLKDSSPALSKFLSVLERAGFRYYFRSVAEYESFGTKGTYREIFDFVVCVYCIRE